MHMNSAMNQNSPSTPYEIKIKMKNEIVKNDKKIIPDIPEIQTIVVLNWRISYCTSMYREAQISWNKVVISCMTSLSYAGFLKICG